MKQRYARYAVTYIDLALHRGTAVVEAVGASAAREKVLARRDVISVLQVELLDWRTASGHRKP